MIEGSRLGGKFLARQVGAGMPSTYLGAPQPAGGWRAFLAGLYAAVTMPQDIGDAQAAACAVFAMFETAATRQIAGA